MCYGPYSSLKFQFFCVLVEVEAGGTAGDHAIAWFSLFPIPHTVLILSLDHSLTVHHMKVSHCIFEFTANFASE